MGLGSIIDFLYKHFCKESKAPLLLKLIDSLNCSIVYEYSLKSDSKVICLHGL